MTNGIADLSVLHDKPYSQIKGDWVKVRQETTDYTEPLLERREATQTEVREGTIVGRGNGTGTYYDGVEKAVMTHSIGPAIYLETPEETVLEVRTDKENNELLDYQNNAD
jgi:hypothetical protein